MSETDYGKPSRENYEKKHPTEDPSIDKAYLEGRRHPGEPAPGNLPAIQRKRRKAALKACRYKRPTNGYKKGNHHNGPAPYKAGDTGKVRAGEVQIDGGIYCKNVPTTDKERVENTYKWVEDFFWPKVASVRGRLADHLKSPWNKLALALGELRRGNVAIKMDIGQPIDPLERNGWFCWEQADFLAFLLRNLGYKVQFKNIIPSYGKRKKNGQEEIKVGLQTAAVNVWYDGKWHFFDPFESFSDKEGGYKAYTKKKGNLGIKYRDAYTFIYEKGNYEGFDWSGPRRSTDTEKGWLTPDVIKRRMGGNNWKEISYVFEAGALFLNPNRELRLGLRIGDKVGGHTSWRDCYDDLLDVSRLPYNRILAEKKGDADFIPANEELLTYSVYDGGYYPIDLLISRRPKATQESRTNSKSNVYMIDMYPSDSPYLHTNNRARSLSIALRPGETKSLGLRLRFVRIAEMGPEPVIDLRDYQDKNKISLAWSPVEQAESYLIYRRTKQEFTADSDLSKNKPHAVVKEPMFQEQLRKRGTYAYAIVAVGKRNKRSILDPEWGSTTVVLV